MRIVSQHTISDEEVVFSVDLDIDDLFHSYLLNGLDLQHVGHLVVWLEIQSVSLELQPVRINSSGQSNQDSPVDVPIPLLERITVLPNRRNSSE